MIVASALCCEAHPAAVAHAIWSTETARVHHAARQRSGGVAFRRIGPVAAQATAHWLSGTSSKAAGARYYSGFAIGMRELGYLEGRDYGFEERYADGDLPRLPLLAEELATLKPDLIVASTTPGAVAAKQASSSIPFSSSYSHSTSSAPQPGLCTNSVRGMSMR